MVSVYLTKSRYGSVNPVGYRDMTGACTTCCRLLVLVGSELERVKSNEPMSQIRTGGGAVDGLQWNAGGNVHVN